jgi:hypothetical protein
MDYVLYALTKMVQTEKRSHWKSPDKVIKEDFYLWKSPQMGCFKERENVILIFETSKLWAYTFL